MKKDRAKGRIIIRIILTVCFVLLVLLLWSVNLNQQRANNLELRSQYTFSVSLDNDANVVNYDNTQTTKAQDDEEYFSLATDIIAKKWIEEFTSQFTQRIVPSGKALKSVNIDEIKVLSESNNIAYIKFSAKLKDKSTEYFSSWNGETSDGRIVFEWVVTFKIEDHLNGVASIYTSNIQSPTEYGMKEFNSKITEETLGSNEEKNNVSVLTGYKIKSNNLMVTYDGGEKYITVPVDINKLMYMEDSETLLREGSYLISNSKTAFLYGGNLFGGKSTPVTLIYSNDKGNNWVTCEIEEMDDASYLYIDFLNENTGVIVIGYPSDVNNSSTRIYTTSDGGENWLFAGNGPLADDIEGVKFIDEKTGFFCYKYTEGMESNLYVTKDSGITFSKVIFEPQELDSSAANAGSDGNTNSKLQWNDVYKIASVPTRDNDGNVIVYLMQTEKRVYNDGKTAAKYQSKDNGNTWEYVGQMEITGTTGADASLSTGNNE